MFSVDLSLQVWEGGRGSVGSDQDITRFSQECPARRSNAGAVGLFCSFTLNVCSFPIKVGINPQNDVENRFDECSTHPACLLLVSFFLRKSAYYSLAGGQFIFGRRVARPPRTLSLPTMEMNQEMHLISTKNVSVK